MNIKIAMLLTFLCLLSACGTGVKLNPKGCLSSARWERHDREILDYESQYQAFSAKELYLNYAFVLKKRINTPLGIFSTREVYLKTLLEREGINCQDIKSLNVTTTNEWPDVITSFIPFLATKTFYIYGQFWTEARKFQTGVEDLKEEEQDELDALLE